MCCAQAMGVSAESSSREFARNKLETRNHSNGDHATQTYWRPSQPTYWPSSQMTSDATDYKQVLLI